MQLVNMFSIIFCVIYSVFSYETSSIQELFLANLSFLLISGFFNNFLIKE